MDENNEIVNYNNYIYGNMRDENKNDITQISKNINKKPQRVKPKFFKLLGQIMNLHVEVINL